MFTGLFITTWHRWNLVGAAVAYGLAMITSNVILMTIALRTSRFFPSITGLWLKAALVDIAVGAMALSWMPLGLTSAALTWLGAMALFLRLARYDRSECICLLQMFSPISVWRSGKY